MMKITFTIRNGKTLFFTADSFADALIGGH